MTSTYINEGELLIQSPFGINAPLIPLTVSSCSGQKLICEDRDYWLPAWRVVDARPGIVWPIGGPKG